MDKMECLEYCKNVYTVKVKSKQRFRNSYFGNHCFIMVLSINIYSQKNLRDIINLAVFLMKLAVNN